MLAERILTILSVTPALQCSACRYAPFYAQKSLASQTFPADFRSIYAPNSSRRIYSTSTPSQPSTTKASDSTFSYRIGASFSGKGRRFDPKEDVYTFDQARAPNSEKDIYTGRPKSGQDAFFVSNAGKNNGVAFGVADGVGGWSDSGIDSAHFSHGMCKWMARIASNGPSSEKDLTPRTLLQSAYDSLVEDGKISGGGSTACIAVGNPNGTLRVSNLGDSGYILLRLNAVHHFSNPQTHAFNTPYQLSLVPPKILALTHLFGGAHLSDSPTDSDTTTHSVRHGDVLIFATDGVWDNLSQLELLKIVSRTMTDSHAWILNANQNGISVSDSLNTLTTTNSNKNKHEDQKRVHLQLQSKLATNIVSEAKSASLDTRRDGPFAKEVQRHYPGENYRGGKVDDICVVVAVVVEEKDKGEIRVKERAKL